MKVGVDNSIHVQTQNWSRSVKTKNLFWCFYLSMGVGSRVADNKEYLHKKTRKPQFFYLRGIYLNSYDWVSDDVKDGSTLLICFNINVNNS